MWDELTYAPRAKDYLATHLQEGTLVLFLGSGSSSGMGLPEWVEFVNDIRARAGLSSVSTSLNAEDLQIAADELRDECASNDEYLKILKECLYKNMKHLSSTQLRSDLLGAIGALLAGSKRGNVQRVMTLNFDSMLEWFLSIYGFVARVVYSLPELEGSEDVRIYHPHGFLPHHSLALKDSDFIILGLDSVNERLGRNGDPWFELTRHVLRTGVCLFVGLSERSFSDRALAPLINTTGKELENERPTGIWLLKNSIADTKKNQFLRNNVVPLVLGTDEGIVDFLLEICRTAARGGIRVH